MKTLVVCLMVCLLAAPLVAIAASPGHSKAFGKSLGEWMNLYWTWFLGGDQDGYVKDVIFLPLPAGEPSAEDPSIFVGEMDFTLHTGEKFILPMFAWVGETYTVESQIPDDDPDLVPAEIFTEATVKIKLDGKLIIDSDEDDIGDYFFDTEWFDETIWYGTPTDYEAAGAIWVKGIGFAQEPLSKGEHTLELFVYSDVFEIGFHNTWNLSVEKK